MSTAPPRADHTFRSAAYARMCAMRMALEVDRPLATCVHVVLDRSRALIFDARQADVDMCTKGGNSRCEPTMDVHRATLPVQYGPNFEGLEFSITGTIPPSDVPSGRMAQLCPFVRDVVCADALVQVGPIATIGPDGDDMMDVDASSVQTPAGTVGIVLSDFLQSDQFIFSGCLGAEDISAVNKCSRMHDAASRARFLQNPFQLACIWLDCQQRNFEIAIRRSEQLRS